MRIKNEGGFFFNWGYFLNVVRVEGVRVKTVCPLCLGNYVPFINSKKKLCFSTCWMYVRVTGFPFRRKGLEWTPPPPNFKNIKFTISPPPPPLPLLKCLPSPWGAPSPRILCPTFLKITFSSNFFLRREIMS